MIQSLIRSWKEHKRGILLSSIFGGLFGAIIGHINDWSDPLVVPSLMILVPAGVWFLHSLPDLKARAVSMTVLFTAWLYVCIGEIPGVRQQWGLMSEVWNDYPLWMRYGWGMTVYYLVMLVATGLYAAKDWKRWKIFSKVYEVEMNLDTGEPILVQGAMGGRYSMQIKNVMINGCRVLWEPKLLSHKETEEAYRLLHQARDDEMTIA